MSITWGQRAPFGFAQADEDLDLVIIGEPDWVRLPPDLGGEVRRVVRIFGGRCPVHPAEVICKHYELEGGVFVAETRDGDGIPMFIWYRRQ